MPLKTPPATDDHKHISFTKADFVQPFLIDHSAIRGRLVRLEKTIDKIITSHEYPLSVSLHLAEQVVLAAMLSATLAGDGILTVQSKGYGGPVKYMIVDVMANGVIRGFARIDEERKGELLNEPMPLSLVFGRGVLAVTLDPGQSEERYQGIVSLLGDSFTEVFQGYFAQSQQAEVSLKVSVRPPESKRKKWAAGGIIIERMPLEGGKEAESTPEENLDLWERTKMFTATVSDKEMLDPEVTPQNLLYRVYNEDGVWVYKLQPLKAGCRCSSTKVKTALKSISEQELLATLDEDGKITIHCEFCNKRRIFTEADIRKLYAKPVSTRKPKV